MSKVNIFYSTGKSLSDCVFAHLGKKCRDYFLPKNLPKHVCVYILKFRFL